MLKTLAVKENNMSSKFSQPFLKKSPLSVGAYEAAADGMAFMGGVITGEKQFAKLNQDIIKGFDNYMEGEGTKQRLQLSSQERIDNLKKDKAETDEQFQKRKKRQQQAHDSRFKSRGGVSSSTQKERDAESVKLGIMTMEEFKEKHG